MIEISFPFVLIRWQGFHSLIYRLSRPLKWIDEMAPALILGPIIAKRLGFPHKKAIPVLFLAGLFIPVPLAFIVMTLFGLSGTIIYLAAWNVILNVFSILGGKKPLPGVAPVIPGLKIGPYYIPFVEGWLSLLIIVLVHEGAHGLSAVLRGVRIDDAALVLLGPFPIGGYVNPDEKEFSSLPPREKIAIASAGPASNLLLFVIISFFILLVSYLLSPIVKYYVIGLKILEVPKTLEINGVERNSLVYGVVKPGDVLIQVDNMSIKSIGDLRKALAADKNVITLTFLREDKVLTVTIPNEGYIGVKGFEYVWKKETPIFLFPILFLSGFLYVLAGLNLAIALANALPFWILDGSIVFNELKKLGMEIEIIKKVVLVLVVLNLLPWLFYLPIR